MTVDRELTVAQSLFEWLPITMTWVYDQVRFADGIRSVVLADNVLNLASFPWTPVYSPSESLKRHPQLRRARALLSRFSMRSYPGTYARAVRAHAPQVLHSHFGTRGWQDLPLCADSGLRQVVTFYGYDIGFLLNGRKRWRHRYARLFERADLFLCEGPHMAATLVQHGCPEDKVHVQHLGVDLGSIVYRRRTPADDGCLRILVSSTFTEKKGIPYGLEAVSLLIQDGRSVKVTVIGDSGGSEDQEREKRKILKTIEDRHLRDHVKLVGYVSREELRRQAYLHDVLLAPSVTAANADSEGGAPVTLVEMSASGMPVVSTLHCDIPNVVEDGVTGCLARERDPEGLARGLARLADDPALRLAMGEAGRRRVEAFFDVRILARQLEDRYRSLC